MQRVDLVIEQGTTWGIGFPLLDANDQPVDLTGWSVRVQARPKADSGTVLFEWASDGSGAGQAVLSNGRVTLYVQPEQSSAWTWRKGHWQLELTTPDGQIIRPVGGRVRVDPEVTR